MFNYNLQEIDYEVFNELNMNRIRYPNSPKGGSETLIRCFISKTDIQLDETLLQSFFALKHSDKALILLLMPPKGGPKMQFIA